MSATDELRRMLDERGVEWDYGITGSTTTMLSVNGIGLTFTPMRDGLVCSTILTPEQVIAATLGSCNCSNDCTNSERTGTCLPHFWTHDGALHIEATRMPTRIVVCEGGTCEFVPKRELDASEAENAKLRELVADMLAFLDGADCARFPAGDVVITQAQVGNFYDRMRELGMEVDA